MNQKENNAKMLDPQRFKIAKNMTVMPGGPENNNPMNVTDIDTPPITAPSIYGDYAQNYMPMGAGSVNPINVRHSPLQQNQIVGQGLNGNPFNASQQPPAMAQDPMESARLDNEVRNRGLIAGAMGLTGSAAVMPGAFPGNMPGTSGPDVMQPMTSMNAMTPGASKTTIKKKRA